MWNLLFRLWQKKWKLALWMISIGLAINCASSTYAARVLQEKQIALTVEEYEFDVMAWESQALWEKLKLFVQRPAARKRPQQAKELVKAYLQRARQIGEKEGEINRILSQNHNQATAEVKTLQLIIDHLRSQQAPVRTTVEQIIEWQASSVIAEAGLQVINLPLTDMPFPPVQFTFIEPPKKLVVSPRERIANLYGQMIQADIPLETMEAVEAQIYKEQKLSAYITGIGGLGAYPTMVIDQASLSWVLSTVIHEWTHNYLAFYALGANYGLTPEIITINETTAEIVGDELGRIVLQRYYPEEIPPEVYYDLRVKDDEPPRPPPEFNFRKEMRETRLTVDKLLEFGRVRDAETYMEARRILFIENGRDIRVINQAFFAFHGSYGTSAASSDPIAPRVFKLRKLSPDAKSFLERVRSVTTLEGLDEQIDLLVKK